MELQYSRNRIYVKEEEQRLIKKTSILLAGSGLGSVIAECTLRLGFENITIVDGDEVEKSNLNRQNYEANDIGEEKVNAIKRRLLSINPKANITVHNCFIDEENVKGFIDGQDIAINALDFTTDIPLKFDKLCQEKGIPVLHPYNLGWGALVAVITPDSLDLSFLNKKSDETFNELKMVDYMVGYMKFWGKPQDWIEKVVNEYKKETEVLSPPQLSVGSWLSASMCTQILFNITTKKEVKKFPDLYFLSINDN
ncbi:ThiF family protein [Tenacibaculum sp. 190524A02b]|uniref:ThiF family protein n=1 Tax=Tenacibaculum vairaonense TaxID=3137860 RepID=A0ABM9PJY6_9FLAO